MKNILFVGYRGRKNHVEPAKKEGHKVYLLTEKSEYKEKYEKHFDAIFQVTDIYDWNQIYKVLKDKKIDAVLTRYEDFTIQVSAIADTFRLPGVEYENAAKFRNKYLMRKAFADHNAPSADFMLIKSINDAEAFIRIHGFPLILKQIAGIHSKYVAKVRNREELETTLKFFQDSLTAESDNMQRVFKNYPKVIETPDPKTYFLLESMLHGLELTVDAFIVDRKIYFTPITKYVLSEDLEFNDHHLPIRIMEFDELETSEKEHIFEVVTQGLEALGADFCTTHTEVFYDREKKDCRLIEIAARGGGFRSEIWEHARSGEYDMAAIRSALGEKPDMSESIHRCAAVVEVFSPENGVLESIDTSFLEDRADVFHITHNRRIGQGVGRASDGKSFVLKFLVEGDKYKEVEKISIDLLFQVQKSIRLKEMTKKLPILMALPHASNVLPEHVRAKTKIETEEIKWYFDVGSRDIYTSEKFYCVPATYNRIFCDLNRAVDHEAGDTPETRSGVVIKTLDTGKEIYHEPINNEEHQERLDHHINYYLEIKKLLEEADIKFFIAGHTMRSYPQGKNPTSENKRADVVISNIDYLSCDRETTELLKKEFESAGYSVAVNDPFGGAFLLKNFAHRDRLPGVQIEFRRGLFMDEEQMLIDADKLKDHHEKMVGVIMGFWEKYQA